MTDRQVLSVLEWLVTILVFCTSALSILIVLIFRELSELWRINRGK